VIWIAIFDGSGGGRYMARYIGGSVEDTWRDI
jgi:hypothetical protein